MAGHIAPGMTVRTGGRPHPLSHFWDDGGGLSLQLGIELYLLKQAWPESF